QRPRHHLPLLSFPTRRSSDLDLPDVETVLVPVGGGGMISGIATAIKLSQPSTKIIGVEPELASDAQASLRSGKIVQFAAEQVTRSEEHTSELQSRENLVCRLL